MKNQNSRQNLKSNSQSKGFSRSQKPIVLSVCLIVKNEEKQLSQCLDSVTAIADEIIIVDTGSSDRTIAIAKRYPTRIYHFQWCDDFSQARNYAIQQAKGQWILVIDADEVLEQSAIAILESVMQQNDCIAANLLRAEIGTNQAPFSYVLRLFRNHPALKFTGCYHESIDSSITKLQEQEPHWRLLNVESVVLQHYGYTDQEINRKQKYEFAKRLMTKHLELFPDDIYMLCKLGALYIDTAKLDAHRADRLTNLALGQQLIQKGMALLPSPNSLIHYELLFHLALAYEYGDDRPLAQNLYLQAIALDIPELVKLGAYMNLGSLYQETQPSEAIAHFAKAVEIAPTYAPAYFNYGIALKTAGRLAEAIAAYEQAIVLQPDYAAAYQNLGVALIKAGFYQKSMTAFTKSIELHEKQGNYDAATLLKEALKDF